LVWHSTCTSHLYQRGSCASDWAIFDVGELHGAV
jgi:hypothetical protein